MGVGGQGSYNGHHQDHGAKTYGIVPGAAPNLAGQCPSDEVIERISPNKRDGKPIGRWVPFTLQLVYRDAKGYVTRTENYSSSEFEPVFPKGSNEEQ